MINIIEDSVDDPMALLADLCEGNLLVLVMDAALPSQSINQPTYIQCLHHMPLHFISPLKNAVTWLQRFNESSMDFQAKLIERGGLGDDTYLPQGRKQTHSPTMPLP